ncbi:hypothetical protein [uncultured Cohaesibacter sp.]|uniref:hypothetical protein n=1 Tax=uncultured Cohaesibacter sp. TaxID=1002546 RepID=UPI0029C6B885|nr:hypothetical protein [uncultured Cohaesibacter sp.]
MGYFLIENFSKGVDVRKSAMDADQGSLRELKNAVVTSGGEIVKRQSFAHYLTLTDELANTVGLRFDASGVLRTYRLQDDETPVVKGNGLLAVDPIIGTGLAAGAERVSLGQATYFNGIPFANILQYDAAGRPIANFAHWNDALVTTLPTGEVLSHFLPFGSKLYASSRTSNLRFSAIGDATDWDAETGVGAGVLSLDAQTAGAFSLMACEPYYDQVALFGENSVQFWYLDPDPTLNRYRQAVHNIGLVGPRALARYGTGDILFLARNGIRSLRSRDSSNSASLNDVGSAIDPWIRDRLKSLTPEQASRIRALIDPNTGNFWMIWGRTAYILSSYPTAKINAWSTFELPFEVRDVAVRGGYIVLRSDDDRIFVYGPSPVDSAGTTFDGALTAPDESAKPFPSYSATQYPDDSQDEFSAVVTTPFIHTGTPATSKDWGGIDVSATGEWHIDVSLDATTPDDVNWTHIATIDHATHQQARVPIDMRSTHMAIRFRSGAANPAGENKLSSVAVHYSSGESS